MRALAAHGLSLALIVLGFSSILPAPAAAQPVEVTLLHISDTHSHLDAWGPKDANLAGTLGGIAKAASLVAAVRASDPAALFVHAGDVMDGDFFFNEYLGVPELQLLRSIGLDAMVLGNHEFRFGPDFLMSVLQSAWPDGGVPILGTNIDPKGHALGGWITPTLIKDAHGVKVGFFGLTPPKGALANPKPVVLGKDLTGISQGAVNALRLAGAQVVVCVSHNGMDVARALAGGVSGIDVIVNGHDNAVLEEPEAVDRKGGGTTLIVSAGNLYRYVGRLTLSVEAGQVSLVDYALLSADADTPSLPAVKAAVDVLKQGIVLRYGDVYLETLGWAGQDITMNWDLRKAKRDTPLGNLFTDGYRASTGTDIAMEPFAYMGDPLPEGAIVGADVFRAMSYGDLAVVDGQQLCPPWGLVTFRTTGAALIHLLDALLTLGGDYFPQVSGIRFDFDSSATEPYGDYFGSKHKVLPDSVHVNGLKIRADQLYSVTVTEGVFSALGGMFYVLSLPAEDVEMLEATAFEAVSALVSQRGDIGPAASGRIRDVAGFIQAKEFRMQAVR